MNKSWLDLHVVKNIKENCFDAFFVVGTTVQSLLYVHVYFLYAHVRKITSKKSYIRELSTEKYSAIGKY